MEELHRLHKDVPFGWTLMLQEAMARRAARKAGKRKAIPYRLQSRFIRGW